MIGHGYMCVPVKGLCVYARAIQYTVLYSITPRSIYYNY